MIIPDYMLTFTDEGVIEYAKTVKAYKGKENIVMVVVELSSSSMMFNMANDNTIVIEDSEKDEWGTGVEIELLFPEDIQGIFNEPHIRTDMFEDGKAFIIYTPLECFNSPDSKITVELTQ